MYLKIVPDGGNFHGLTAVQAFCMAHIAVQLDYKLFRDAGFLVQVVDVLSDDTTDLSAPYQLGDGVCAVSPSLGFTVFHVSSISNRRRQLSRRASAEDMNSLKWMGFILVQMPPGERKSGMPDSVEMPAPEKNDVARCLQPRSIAARASAPFSTSMFR